MTAAKGSFQFTRKERINDPQDFRRVMKTGSKLTSRNFILFMKENEEGCHRLGVVVSKEVGRATYRNRIKRICREFFRLHKHRIKGTVDIIILARKGCSLTKYSDAKQELGRVFAV